MVHTQCFQTLNAANIFNVLWYQRSCAGLEASQPTFLSWCSMLCMCEACCYNLLGLMWFGLSQKRAMKFNSTDSQVHLPRVTALPTRQQREDPRKAWEMPGTHKLVSISLLVLASRKINIEGTTGSLQLISQHSQLYLREKQQRKSKTTPGHDSMLIWNMELLILRRQSLLWVQLIYT